MRPRSCLLIGLLTLASAGACGGTAITNEVSDTDAGGTGGTPSQPEAGTSDAVPDTSVPASLEGLAFDIEIPLPESGYLWCQGDCTPATALITRVDGTSMELVWGATGRATARSLKQTAEGWELTDTLQLGTVWTWDHAMCPNESNLGPAVFDFADHDDDGVVDLVISGHQESTICSDDYTSGTSGEVTLLGRPHEDVPEAVGPSGPIETLRELDIKMTEPLGASATCELSPDGGGAPIPMQAELENGYVVAFSTARVLPLGATYTAQITGTSFTGEGVPAPISIQTLADFGVLEQDGFESGSMEGISGATIVDASQIPAIEGERMLLVEPGVPMLLRLRGTAGEQKLVIEGRVTDGCGWGAGAGIQVLAGVIGSDAVVDDVLVMGLETETVTFEGNTLTLGELQTSTLPLQGGGDDVLVYMRGEYYMGAGCALTGAVLDNVRLE